MVGNVATLCWDEVSERKLIRPELVQQTEENIRIIKEKLKAATDKQKSYVDLRRQDIEYNVGDKVFLKGSPLKHIMRFGKKGKLSPRFIRLYRSDPSHILPLESIKVNLDLTYDEEPMANLAKKTK
ncbi:uncharacterized protein LOC131177912 [Hevea brasiliensis]|uniref:uncharacterized protein LOC131177912 n=1 Tax=Hevea brasiliensis TaxID=3981 RepID=UPI0025DA5303|nr:uncharacterized protein LOC131177912 [Hevea brasiliensis]